MFTNESEAYAECEAYDSDSASIASVAFVAIVNQPLLFGYYNVHYLFTPNATYIHVDT